MGYHWDVHRHGGLLWATPAPRSYAPLRPPPLPRPFLSNGCGDVLLCHVWLIDREMEAARYRDPWQYEFSVKNLKALNLFVDLLCPHHDWPMCMPFCVRFVDFDLSFYMCGFWSGARMTLVYVMEVFWMSLLSFDLFVWFVDLPFPKAKSDPLPMYMSVSAVQTMLMWYKTASIEMFVTPHPPTPAPPPPYVCCDHCTSVRLRKLSTAPTPTPPAAHLLVPHTFS